VAFVDDQTIDEDWPEAIEAGLAEMVTVGTDVAVVVAVLVLLAMVVAAATVTFAEAVPVPVAPTQFKI
jgi:hypothetical protein